MSTSSSSSSSSSSSKKRKGKQSQTQTPTTKNPQPEDDEKCQETTEPIILVPDIPEPIVINILSRTSIRTLFNCRLVCKNWATLTSIPEFAQLHLSRSPTSCLINPHLISLQSKGLDLVDLEYPFNPSNKLVFLPNINFPKVPIRLFNSCNGLVCLSPLSSAGLAAYNICVCNPVLRQCITLPKPPAFKNFLNHPCALGFNHKTNQYKVVLSLEIPNSLNFHTDIYTLGECSWRSIGNSSYRILNDGFCAFLNGALHWISQGLEGPFLCCFDFVSEQFGEIPKPSEMPFYYTKKVSVINGNLSICDLSDNQIAIWVMKEYGVKESWSKDIVITRTTYGYDSCKPIMINGNGKILMIYNNRSFICYDPESKALIESEIQILSGTKSGFEAIAYVPSLISLNDVARGSNLKVSGMN